jgi:hypothetical protein
MKRHHPRRIGRQHTGQTIKITTLALIATATVAATIALPAVITSACRATHTSSADNAVSRFAYLR